MRSSRSTRAAAVAAIAGTLTIAGAGSAVAAPASTTDSGPSTSTAPYVVPVADGVSITSLLSDGDVIGGYTMAAIPDGLGATAGEDGTMTLLMNHEYGNGQGPEGGSFVSTWTLDPKTGTVTSGKTLFGGSGYSRFCSGTLSEPGIFSGTKGTGFDGQIYFANEEAGDNGRTFGVTVEGVSAPLPDLGLASIENTVPAKTRGDVTVLLSNEDAGPASPTPTEFDSGQIRVYVGAKKAEGSAFDRAGLTGGDLFVLTAAGSTGRLDLTTRPAKGTFDVTLSPAIDTTKNGSDQNKQAKANGISFNRIEDGHFDPRKPNDYYFLTTDGGAGSGNAGGGGGLWRLSFADVSNPSMGGTLTLLLDGTEGIALQKPDNMTIDNGGNILIQEDPGSDPVRARIVAYRIADGATGVVAQFNEEQFGAGKPTLVTTDEESSGIIDVSGLWKTPNTFLFDAQVHNGEARVGEKGQLLVMNVQSWGQVYGR